MRHGGRVQTIGNEPHAHRHAAGWRRGARGAIGLLFGALALGGVACREPEPSARGGGESEPLTDLAATARRPARSYVLARSAEGCELYWLEGSATSRRTPTPCPAELVDGERIRLAGDACLREGITPRARPVVCPQPLVELELQGRAKR